MSAYRQSIRIIYPHDAGRIALRTDENWDVDVGVVSRRGSTTKFQIETDRPYFYFKPVLILGLLRNENGSAREMCFAVFAGDVKYVCELITRSPAGEF